MAANRSEAVWRQVDERRAAAAEAGVRVSGLVRHAGISDRIGVWGEWGGMGRVGPTCLARPACLTRLRVSLIVFTSDRFADHLTPPGHPERVERAEVMQVVASEWGKRGGTVIEPVAATESQ